MNPKQPVNILLVDDQPAKLLSYETILGVLGENLIRANSGNEALEALLKQPIALVLVDVCMPEMDGFELASMIRSHPRFQRTAIILVSGVMVEDTHRLRGYDSGAVDYVSVPIVPEILRAKVSVFAELFRKTDELLLLNEQLAERTVQLQEELAMRQAAEERTRQYALELERSNLELQQFASVASHDLQEPLRMVSTFVGMLRENCQGKLDAESEEFMGYIVEGAARIKLLIADLLTYSQVRTEPADLQRVDCEAVLQNSFKDISLLIDDRKAKVTHDPLPEVWAVRSQVAQVLQNLVTNGIKFSGPRRPEVHVSAQLHGNEWIFSVRDNGIGIGEEDFERIFVIFQRLHERGKYPGTGIGLAICKKIIEGHGGRIWVESEPGQGSTFLFSLRSATPDKPTVDETANKDAQVLSHPSPRT